MSKQQYWLLSAAASPYSVEREYRAQMAWELIERFGIISGKRGEDDTAGRATVDVEPPSELVARAFAIVDEYMRVATERGELREFTEADLDAAHIRGGELARLQSDAQYPRPDREAVREAVRETRPTAALAEG